jgi:hypothetical protein
MKTKLVLASLVLLVLAAGCKKLAVNFSVKHQTNFRVETNSPLNLPFESATPDVTTNSSQDFQNNNTSSNLIKEVKLQELKISITNPTTKTFSFLKSVKLFISLNGTEEMELASLDNISATSQSILLTTTDQNLVQYLKASKYSIRTQVVTKETITQPVDIRTDLTFRVKASPL